MSIEPSKDPGTPLVGNFGPLPSYLDLMRARDDALAEASSEEPRQLRRVWTVEHVITTTLAAIGVFGLVLIGDGLFFETAQAPQDVQSMANAAN